MSDQWSNPYGDRPYGDRPYGEQPYGQPNPGPQYPGQQYPGQQYPGQPHPGQQYPAQPYTGQPTPANQPIPGMHPVEQRPPGQPRRRRQPPPPKKKSGKAAGCLIVLIVLAMLGVGAWFGAGWVMDKINPTVEDYPGPGKGNVTFEVQSGDVSAEIGRNLKAAGVVKSVDAFIEQANENPTEAQGIQVGFYELKKKMAAEDAFKVLIDPKNQLKSAVTIPEGLRTDDIVATLAKNTDFSKAQFTKALKQDIGLPKYAKGNPEGYLYPATYNFGPKDKPKQMLTAMVDRWQETAESLDFAKAAKARGYTPQEIMTAASLAQNEGKTRDDMRKIVRVIDNRIEKPNGGGGTAGLLQIDATVDYALGRPLTTQLTQAERENTDSPYNTFVSPGLPPGPISSPGEDAIAAALDPAKGDWFYYITVNLKTGETKFAETYEEFQKYNDELRDYCENESAGAC